MNESIYRSSELVRRSKMSLPKYDDLFNPLLEAIKRLGGSASVTELNEEVTKNLNLTDEEIATPHDERMTELEYRLTWTRHYLKAYGLLNNSERGIWVLTTKGKETERVDPPQVRRFVIGQSRDNKNNSRLKKLENNLDIEEADTILEEKWREELLAKLLQLSPAAFERLAQRLLRESGFVEVKVTGRSGDGGIDGIGVIRL